MAENTIPEIDFLAEDSDILVSQMKNVGQFFGENLVNLELSKDILEIIPGPVAAQYRIIPIKLDDDGTLVLATDLSDTLQIPVQLGKNLGRPIRLLLADELNVQTALREYYDISNYNRARSASLTNVQNDVANSPLQKKVDEILQYGAEVDASDIHIKQFSGGVYVWMRINGELKDFTNRFSLSADDGETIANIVKGKDQSSNADAGNKTMPNNGAFIIQRAGVPIRCRLATVPDGPLGDEMVQKLDVRLMPQVRKRISLETLYSGEDLKNIKNALFRSSSGMFINAGPVGTGKTTSLYAEIDYLWNEAVARYNLLHVFTIEKPIEIRDERYTQVQIRETRDETTSLTALVALDAALRSDPNVILFGEIRNTVEADAAMKASQTGLRMFSTIHAGNCVKTILRLLNLGVDPLSMLSEMRFVMSQRLIPSLCPDCSREHTLSAQEKEILSKEEIDQLSGAELRERGSIEERAKCTNRDCHNGIIQRVAVPEYIVFNNQIRDALLHQTDFDSVEKLLKEHNFQSMWEKGLRMVENGHAELADVINIIGKED